MTTHVPAPSQIRTTRGLRAGALAVILVIGISILPSLIGAAILALAFATGL